MQNVHQITTIDFHALNPILAFLILVYLIDVYPKLERRVKFPRGWSKTGKLGYRIGGGPELIMHAGQMEIPCWKLAYKLYTHLHWQNEKVDSKTREREKERNKSIEGIRREYSVRCVYRLQTMTVCSVIDRAPIQHYKTKQPKSPHSVTLKPWKHQHINITN